MKPVSKARTIILPQLVRTSAGHVIYGAYEDSICPYHQFCAYTGDEKDRCKLCHSDTHLADDHGDIPPGRISPCLCPRCGELFTAVTPFGIHFRANGRCGNPEKRGLILVEQNGWSLWAKPGSMPEGVH